MRTAFSLNNLKWRPTAFKQADSVGDKSVNSLDVVANPERSVPGLDLDRCLELHISQTVSFPLKTSRGHGSLIMAGHGQSIGAKAVFLPVFFIDRVDNGRYFVHEVNQFGHLVIEAGSLLLSKFNGDNLREQKPEIQSKQD